MKIYRNRFFRTLFLAVFAAVTFVASAIFIFDVHPKIMLDFFLASLLGVGLMIVVALIFTALKVLISKWIE